MDSKKMISPRKRIRKYHTRKAPIINSYTDMAEARREIVHALHLHRSSSFNNPNNYALLGQRVNSQQYYYSIVESMPIPKPTWSTTAPAIHTAPPPPPPPPPPPSSSEFDWWLGFLKSLDVKKNTSRNDSHEVDLQKYFPENILMENSKVISQLQDGLKKDSTNNLIDEWLIIPTPDDDNVLIEF
ncbi:uncharacterized protein LOC125817039 [Solanum verrucosum]|uniref:uncharacterized protein LOC125817039 n=1 Tax=Solanum verrucosum TaxID=315347 RepID=UPI0020D0F190|nr:uncharacterized protein LOC125817039 [Solanum verrucosum]